MYDFNPNEYDIDGIRSALIDAIGPATPAEQMANADLVAAETCSPYELIMMAKSYGIDVENYRNICR